MNPLILVFVVMIGVMFLMTRSARNKQRQSLDMRNKMEPGSGVRTIGGMYAVVKEVNEETVLLELTDGVHAHFAKNAIGTVLSEEEFNRIVHGIEPEDPADADEYSAEAVSGDAAATDDVLTKDTDQPRGGTPAVDGEPAVQAEPVVQVEPAEPAEHVALKKSEDAPEQDGSGSGSGAR